MTHSITVHAREALFVKRSDLPRAAIEDLREKLTFRFYDEKACDKCEYKPERHNPEVCDECAAFKGGAELMSEVVLAEKKYIKVPIGNPQLLVNTLKEHDVDVETIKPHFPTQAMSRPIKFTGTLRDYQPAAVKAMIVRKRGVLKAPPRSGKCIVGSSLVMTDRGVSRIKDLFDDFELPEDEFYARSDLSIATVGGQRKLKHLYSKVVDQTVNVSTAHGYNVRATANHRLLVAENCELVWKSMDEIQPGDFIVHSRKEQWLGSGNNLRPFNFVLRANTCNVILHQLPRALTPELARLTGYLTANGSLNLDNNRRGRIAFTSNNKKVLRDYVHCLASCFPGLKYDYKAQKKGEYAGQIQFSSVQVKQFLLNAVDLPMCKSAGKHIPSTLMGASKELMLQFLSAYVSCDSWVHKTGIQLCTASRRLADELHAVLGYLGCMAQRKEAQGYARNGSGTVRRYHNLFLHALDAGHLLQQIELRKKNRLTDNTFVDTNDVLPGVKEALLELQARCGTQNTWTIGGKQINKAKVGTLLFNSRGQLTRAGHFNRNGIKNINMRLVRELDPKLANKLERLFNEALYLSPVTTVKVINKPVRVYDVEVPVKHHFVANGIVNHNTVMATAAVCKIGMKTIIMASQRDWLVGFQETFVGSQTQEALTNIKKDKIGFAKTYEDFCKYDVCLVTCQTFWSEKGQKLLRKVRNMFAVVVVDEIHTGAAPKYATVLAGLNCKWKIGLSGTPNRKDGRFILMRNLIGPVIYEAKVQRLRPHVALVRTQYTANHKGNVLWTRMVSALEKDPKRLKLIAQWAIKDAKAGHMVLIPLSQITPIKALVMAINKIAGKKLAYAFTGQLGSQLDKNTGKKRKLRDIYIEAARNYKLKILVGTGKLLTTGINIPRASCIYDVAMSSNMENCEQRVSRILTPWEGKPTPKLRIFLDDSNVRRKCLANEWWGCVRPKFRPVISEVDETVLKGYFANKDTMKRLEL